MSAFSRRGVNARAEGSFDWLGTDDVRERQAVPEEAYLSAFAVRPHVAWPIPGIAGCTEREEETSPPSIKRRGGHSPLSTLLTTTTPSSEPGTGELGITAFSLESWRSAYSCQTKSPQKISPNDWFTRFTCLSGFISEALHYQRGMIRL